MSMSSSELLPGGQGFFGSRFVKAGTLPGPHSPEYVLATGIGSRGGPNKPSNKLKRTPGSYLYD